MMNKQSLLRQLPSVNELLQHPQAAELVADFGHELTVEAVRTAVDEARQAILRNGQTISVNSETLLTVASSWLYELITPTLYPVINATGVIVHTNLGRAPLSAEARHAIDQAAASYSNLEYDVPSGKRGSRTVHAEQLLQRITGAEAALTVNNNASAVILMLMALCQGKEVIISR
ncbi:MAG: L-seryl-tRNA(Sec) selenium transferase, partial [Anaerolineales bacterium]|nr:L-seryl-tRNA(Sec) selenium transferase [Anaerolineales bacterium]